jgi:hypothetical protein
LCDKCIENQVFGGGVVVVLVLVLFITTTPSPKTLIFDSLITENWKQNTELEKKPH